MRDSGVGGLALECSETSIKAFIWVPRIHAAWIGCIELGQAVGGFANLTEAVELMVAILYRPPSFVLAYPRHRLPYRTSHRACRGLRGEFQGFRGLRLLRNFQGSQGVSGAVASPFLDSRVSWEACNSWACLLRDSWARRVARRGFVTVKLVMAGGS